MSINGRIKKSAGCRREFSDPFDLIFVELVVQHVERDYYNDKNRFRQIITADGSDDDKIRPRGLDPYLI